MPADAGCRPGRNPVVVSLAASHPFTMLGWVPGGSLRSQYQVRTTQNDQGFEAYGMTDLDGDGELCVWKSTQNSNVHMIVANNVY